MKFFVLCIFAAVSAGAYGRFQYPGDVYGASLSGAPVGIYGKTYGGREIYAASLGGAKVGVYGKETRPYYVRYVPYYGGVIPVRSPKPGKPPKGGPKGRVLGPVSSVLSALPALLPRHLSPDYPHSSISAAGSYADSLRHKTGAGSYSYEGNYNPLGYIYPLDIARPPVVRV